MFLQYVMIILYTSGGLFPTLQSFTIYVIYHNKQLLQYYCIINLLLLNNTIVVFLFCVA